jgi:predicted permease
MHALRALIRSPGFTLISIVTLALGIGLNTAMFSVINTLLLAPPPFRDPDNLFIVLRTTSQERQGGHAPASVEELARESAPFTQLAAYRYWGYTLSERNRPAEVVNVLRVSSNFFNVLGVTPELGRSFLPEEDTPGRNNVVMLSHSFWLSRFSGDPAIVGRTIRLDGGSIEVVGVLPESAAAPTIFGPINIFRPRGLTADEKANWTDYSYSVFGRYSPQIGAAQTRARFSALASRMAADHPKELADTGLRIDSLQSTTMDTTSRQITFMLLGLSGFVLLIACANLANLLLARAITRSREFAIRAAIGASRAQMIRPIVAECALLAAGGGALGILISRWTVDWVAREVGGELPPVNFALDWRVLLFAAAVSLATAIFFGVAPALLVVRVPVNETLKSATRGTSGSRSHNRYRQVLIAGQFALALVLLAGAVFFVRGLDNLISSPSGWDPAPLLHGNVSLPTGVYTTPARMMAFYTQLEHRLAAVPGVESVSVSYSIPLYTFPSQRAYAVEGHPPPVPNHEPVALVNGVTSGYFATLGTRVLQGRAFAATDRIDSQQVVIINRSMARDLFPNEDPIGRRLSPVGEREQRWLTIVGVVDDVRSMNITPPPTRFQLYLPLTQETWGFVSVTARTSRPAKMLMEPFRRAVTELDPEMPLLNLMPVPERISRNMRSLRLINQLLVGFASLGLFLAALGIYGVITRLVVQRTGEIGIRMALGAQAGDVVRMILGTGLRMVIFGAALGLLGALVLARFLAGAMPGLATSNLAAIAFAAGALGSIALLSCYIPAKRAAKVDPLIALRSE